MGVGIFESDQSGGSRFKLQAGLKEEICVSLLQLASQHRWVVETVGVWLFLSTVVINLNTHTPTHILITRRQNAEML